MTRVILIPLAILLSLTGSSAVPNLGAQGVPSEPNANQRGGSSGTTQTTSGTTQTTETVRRPAAEPSMLPVPVPSSTTQPGADVSIPQRPPAQNSSLPGIDPRGPDPLALPSPSYIPSPLQSASTPLPGSGLGSTVSPVPGGSVPGATGAPGTPLPAAPASLNTGVNEAAQPCAVNGSGGSGTNGGVNSTSQGTGVSASQFVRAGVSADKFERPGVSAAQLATLLPHAKQPVSCVPASDVILYPQPTERRRQNPTGPDSEP
jgi:hypothetical protein